MIVIASSHSGECVQKKHKNQDIGQDLMHGFIFKLEHSELRDDESSK